MRIIIAKKEIDQSMHALIEGNRYYIDKTQEFICYRNEWLPVYEDQEDQKYIMKNGKVIYFEITSHETERLLLLINEGPDCSTIGAEPEPWEEFERGEE